MSDLIHVGDRVRLLRLPEWLTHDLPESEKAEMLAFVGQSAVVTDIDRDGYFWLGFGSTKESNDAAFYSGHSFGVPADFLERA